MIIDFIPALFIKQYILMLCGKVIAIYQFKQ